MINVFFLLNFILTKLRLFQYWHWRLEVEAARLVENCQLNKSITKNFFLDRRDVAADPQADVFYGRLFRSENLLCFRGFIFSFLCTIYE